MKNYTGLCTQIYPTPKTQLLQKFNQRSVALSGQADIYILFRIVY
jgi:hypothetical protein